MWKNPPRGEQNLRGSKEGRCASPGHRRGWHEVSSRFIRKIIGASSKIPSQSTNGKYLEYLDTRFSTLTSRGCFRDLDFFCLPTHAAPPPIGGLWSISPWFGCRPTWQKRATTSRSQCARAFTFGVENVSEPCAVVHLGVVSPRPARSASALGHLSLLVFTSRAST